MKTIKRVALIGAGAIGAYFIWGFDGVDSIDFRVIADGSRGERLAKDGIKVNGTVYHPVVSSTANAGIQDLVIVSVKYGALNEANEMLKQLVGPDTLVLTVLNGVDSEEIVGDAIGREHILHSVMKITSKRTEDGVVFQTGSVLGVFFGSAFQEKKAGEEACRSVCELLDQTKVGYAYKENIMYEMWFKFACNVSANLPQAVLGTGAGIYRDSEHGLFLSQKLWDEVRALAGTKGVVLQEKVRVWTACAKASRFSTLQDLDAGRHTEIDMFAGALVRMSQEAGLQAPYAEYTYHAIKALEEKNDGCFDYHDM